MRRSLAAVMVLLAGMLYAVICQAQILGTGQLNTARRSHTATLLQDGKILIVGGDDASGLVGQAELFDPASLTSSNIAANPITLRTDHTATLLSDGRVLIIGGVDGNGSLASTEIYNPYSVPAPSFSAGPSLQRARSGHTATVLANGKILILGGESTGSAEIYDPATQSFSLVNGSLNTPRQYHSAALLNSGRVLIVGGIVGANTTLTSAEIYDPQTQTFTPASGPMQTARGLALLRVLPDGKIQIIGGDGEFSMEMFDPATNSFIALAHVPPHEDYLDNILASRTRSALITTIIQQNPVLQGQPELTPEIIALLNRLDHTVTEIPQSNRALIAGGVNDAGQILSSATMVSSSAATVTTDKFDYAPGETVTITGQAWQPNETVWMLLHEEPETHDDVITSSVADNQGNFTNSDFAPATADAGRSFTLTAIGQTSGFTTQTAFKDAPRIASVSVGAQTGTLTFGTAGSATYAITPGRGNNGTVNGTLSVISGLPTGVTASFSPNSGTWTSNGGTAFPSFTLTLTTSATTPAGTFTFTMRAADGSDQATNTGTLAIGKATPTITWNNPADITYGTALSGTQLNAIAAVPGSFVYTPAAGTVLSAGNGQTLHVDFTPTDTANYNNASKNVTINVQKATPTINWSNPADITYGTALSATQLNATASAVVNGSTVSVAGTFTYTPASGTVLSAGNGQTLHVSFAPTDTINYSSPVTKDVTINVLKKDATWTTNPNSKIYGDADPVPLTTGSGSGFLAADNVTATYNRIAGENASPPTYHITATLSATPLAALNNYNITNTGNEFTINKRNATWTTNAASKTYGDDDPVPLTTGSGSGFLAADSVTATYSRAAGESVAGNPYHISATLSPTGVLVNYNITNAGADFTINKKNASVNATDASKIYGDADPTLTATNSGFLTADLGPTKITFSASRIASENVGTYAITPTSSDNGTGLLNNYNVTFNNGTFTINKRSITITADAKSKTYGDADPALTYQITSGSLKSGDSVTGSLTRDASENVGTYAIRQGTLAVSDGNSGNNYNLTFVGANLTINKRPVTITVDAKTKIYGDADPTLTYQITAGSLKSGDSITGSLARAAGENVGAYAITQGTSAISDGNGGNNYDLTFVGANLTINKRPITITADAKSKIYGDADPAPTYLLTSGSLKSGDSIIGALARATGESVGTYAITQGTLAVSDGNSGNNYDLTFIGALLTVNKRPASVTPDAASKTYGDADPALTGTLSGFLVADGVTASYSRSAGDTVGTYTISATLNPAGVLGNYDITYNTAIFTINKKAASVTPNAASKFYGSVDPAFTGTLAGFLAADGVTATYSRTAGETVVGSPYPINATLSPAGVLGNYDIAYNTANFTITKADPIVTATGKMCTYDGNPCAGSGAAAGVLGENLTPVMVAYTVIAAPPRNPGDLLTSAPVNAGTYYIAARYAGDANYNAKQSAAATITINKAAATIILSGATTYIYDGTPKFATADTNPAGLSGVMITYNGSPTPPTNPGVYSVVASLTNANYQAPDATGTLVILARPIASDQSVSTNEDTAAPITLTASDLDSPTLTFSIVTGPNHGSLTGTPPNVNYTPFANYNGTDGFTFKATDSDSLDSNIATVSITVNAVNDKPQAQAQSVATDEDVPVVITLRGRDLDSTALTFSIAGGPNSGSLGTISVPVCTQVPNPSGTQGVSCAATVTYTPAPNYNGPDSFTFTTNDGALDSAIATVTITANPVNDTPTATAQSVITDDINPLAITLTGSDIETAPTNLTFTIVTPPAHGSISGTAPNVTYTPLFNYKGPDSFTFTVTDRSDPDNCGAPNASCADVKTSPMATVSITVTDGSAPNTLLTTTVPTTLSNDRNPTFGFAGSDNVTSDADIAFECTLDFVAFSACGSPGNFSTSYTALADGSHTFQVRAKDQSGNMDATPASYTWTIDATPPDTVIDSQPPALASSATASFTFHSTENNSTLSCSLDSGTAVACGAGNKTYTGLSDGQHTFTVVATDQAGNVAPTPASFTWAIDTTAPQTSIDSQPTNPTTIASASFTFHGSDPAGQDTFECSLDGAAFAACTTPKTYNGLALGNHSFAVRAKDSVGNMDATPASHNWTIGAVTIENYTMDTDFKRFDGFDVVFGKGTGSYQKINSTNPDSFHYQIKLSNNTGTPIGTANGNTATAIITVPGMPASCGGVPCSTQIGSLADPAFILKDRKVAHVWPGYHDRDDDDDDDMPVSVKYMTLAQYQANGNSCADNPSYSSTLPSNGAPKCIKISGFTIAVKHAARIRLNFQFRLKGTDGWNANSQQLFYAGFIFRTTTSVTFGSNVQTATDSAGIVGAGSKTTAIGGYAFNNLGAPLSSYVVRVFNKPSEASCTINSKLIAQDIVDANGFYYIWRTGSDQHIVAPNLPSGVQYAIQLCNGPTQVGLKTTDSKLHEKEFEQVDFNP